MDPHTRDDVQRQFYGAQGRQWRAECTTTAAEQQLTEQFQQRVRNCGTSCLLAVRVDQDELMVGCNPAVGSSTQEHCQEVHLAARSEFDAFMGQTHPEDH